HYDHLARLLRLKRSGFHHSSVEGGTTQPRPRRVGRAGSTISFEPKRFKCFIDMSEMNIEGAQSIDICRGKFCRDPGFGLDIFGECPLARPRFHRGALDSFISSFSVRARTREREQDRLTEVQSFCEREILLHPLGINLEPLDYIAQFVEHIIDQNARVW